ncbi:CheR family methyltransferase [Mangrovihabitans endophyticus]|uniref:protein-glutamate O-methyltransferase n=1 Tax=Mangrovihabitans endophyticus TaxID=1751298 RepID=A0A8J3FRJ3_9ACTN|nr:CheR family methyltransferase [Mangrovihabitans endophyticus]GGL07452.1 chemotaxis protein methyltransferase [Mangrovihabitans endophyticus]
MTHATGVAPPGGVPAPRGVPAPISVADIVAGQEILPLTAKEFAWIGTFMHRHTGVQLKAGKEFLVMGRLTQRLRHYGLRDFGSYIELLGDPGHEVEVQTAINLLTTNETYFFREPKHFAFLREAVDAFRADPANRGRVFRLWSAASSTGEEAYTAAMVLAEAMPSGQWEIVGTDVSTRVLNVARRGLYSLAAAEKIPQPMLSRHCLRGTGEFEGQLLIDGKLRSKVSFRPGNLLESFADREPQDIVFLRNVMIYYDNQTKQDLIARIEQVLRPGGHLLIGHSETLHGIGTDLRMVQPAVYRREAG